MTTTYEWNALDELVGVDTGLQEVTYTYDALGRRAARSAPSGTQGAHYGDLTDVPILDTDSEGKATTSYVQGPQGLIEQRSGEATSFPLPDAHGDVTALLDAEGGVASRHSYDPWGVQLSGPSLEMGYLGAQQRRTDPATGLIQMGIRPYSPALASFIAEDPVLGHFGIGTSIDRYAYVWDNPLNLYDLDGRTASGLGATGLLGDAWDATGGKAWDATAGARTAAGLAGDGNGGWLNESPGFASDRARDFVKLIMKNVPFAEELNNAVECLGEAIARPTEDLDCLPDTPDDPLEPEDPPDPPDSFPPPPPSPPTPLPGPRR